MSVHVRTAWRQVWNQIKQEKKIILQTELTIENFPGQIKYKQVACDNLWTYKHFQQIMNQCKYLTII